MIATKTVAEAALGEKETGLLTVSEKFNEDGESCGYTVRLAVRSYDGFECGSIEVGNIDPDQLTNFARMLKQRVDAVGRKRFYQKLVDHHPDDLSLAVIDGGD